MKIDIKNLHGDTYNFEIEENETVKALKEMIAARDGLREKYTVDIIKLLCAGNVMEDEEVLKTFDIKPDGFLVLVKQTPGKQKPPPKKKLTFPFTNMMNGFGSPFGMSQMSSPLMSQPFSNKTFMEAPFPQSFSSHGSTYSPNGYTHSPHGYTHSSQGYTHSSQGSTYPGMNMFDGLSNPTENLFATNEDHEQGVKQLEDMGFTRSQAEKALRDCSGSLEAAVEYLTSGIIIPEDDPPLPPVAAGLTPTPLSAPVPTLKPPVIQQSPSSSSNTPSGSSAGAALSFQELGRMLEQHPEQLQTLKERLRAQHPEIAELIDEDPEAFLEVVREAAGKEISSPTSPSLTDTPTTDNISNSSTTNTNSTNTANPSSAAKSLSAYDLQVIQRIVGMGFEESRVIEAFLACDRNEQMAVHYLLSVLHD